MADIKPWSIEYDDFLHDESKKIGHADSISFPTSEQDVISIINNVSSSNQKITIQGARTGITAGAVPDGGHVMNLSRMNSISDIKYHNSDETHSIIVQPGAILNDIRKVIDAENLFFPPDPTETTASIGGMASCNASGALTYKYGPVRNWIRSLRIVLPNNGCMYIKRKTIFADGYNFLLAACNGSHINGTLPNYTMPNVKSAAGYYIAKDMDIIDLFIGMEGTLGIITELELVLTQKPNYIHGLIVFFDSEQNALSFVNSVKTEPSIKMQTAAIEYFNHDALNLLRRMKSERQLFSDIPDIPAQHTNAVYAELHCSSESEMDDAIMTVLDLIINTGSCEDDTWYATNERELILHKTFRHAVPEAVNLYIGEQKKNNPEITKLGTDMSVPDDKLNETMSMYNSELAAANLKSVIFGHIGNNHLHVNILPHSYDEYITGKELYKSWASRIVAYGGSVSAEHGIGKLKTEFLELMYGKENISQMKALRDVFDPDNILNPGNLFGIA